TIRYAVVVLSILSVSMVTFVMVEFGSHGCTVPVIADDERHCHRVRDASQICMLAFHLALESMAPNSGNLCLQSYAIDRSLELKASFLILCEGSGWDGRGERASPTRKFEFRIFCQRMNPVAAGTQGETG